MSDEVRQPVPDWPQYVAAFCADRSGNSSAPGPPADGLPRPMRAGCHWQTAALTP